ncbi:hypothetical protein D3C75_644470 [compost metagenome]
MALDHRSAGLLALTGQVAITRHPLGKPSDQLSGSDPLGQGRAFFGGNSQANSRQCGNHLLGAQIRKTTNAMPGAFVEQIPGPASAVFRETKVQRRVAGITQITDMQLLGVAFDLSIRQFDRQGFDQGRHARAPVGFSRSTTWNVVGHIQAP